MTFLLGFCKLFKVHLELWADASLRNFEQEILYLLSLLSELAVFLVEVIDDPNRVFIKLVSVLVAAIVDDHRHVKELGT